MKCHFCDKEAVNPGEYKFFLYCKDHEHEAKVEEKDWEQIEKALEGSEEYSD